MNCLHNFNLGICKTCGEPEFSNGGNFNAKKDCPKCGNPLKMYWCKDCGEVDERKVKCVKHGKLMVVDKDYHLECN
jgi:uncharacterized protein YlaI